MSRPQTPSAEDLANEDRVMPILSRYLNCRVEKSPDPFATYDFKLITEGVHWGWAEYRRRKFKVSKYDTIILSKHKFLPDNKLETYFVVEWDDMIGIKLLGMSWRHKAKMFERTANLRPGDRPEPVVHLSTSSFVRIG